MSLPKGLFAYPKCRTNWLPTATPTKTVALALAQKQGCPLDLDSAIFFAARDEIVRSKDRPRLAGWRRMIFAFMYRNAVRVPDRFDLPADRFLEVGRQVALWQPLHRSLPVIPLRVAWRGGPT